MDVIAVINKLVEYFVRLVLIFYGLADLLGIFWFQDSIYLTDLIEGLSFSLAALFIGCSPISVFNTKILKIVYLGVSILGILPSIYMAYQYSSEDYRGWIDIVEQLLLLVCFLYMVTRVLSNKSFK